MHRNYAQCKKEKHKKKKINLSICATVIHMANGYKGSKNETNLN